MPLQSHCHMSWLWVAFLFVSPGSACCEAQVPDILPAYFSRISGFEVYKRDMHGWPPKGSFLNAFFFATYSDAFAGPNELSKDQLSELKTLLTKWNATIFAVKKDNFDKDISKKLNESPKDLTPQQRELVLGIAKKLFEEHDADLAKIVSPDQIYRAKQLHLQSLEAQAFLLADIVDLLTITKEQTKKITSIIRAHPLPPPPDLIHSFSGKLDQKGQARNTKLKKAYGKSLQRVSTVRYEEAMKVLTPEQQDQYQKLIGPFAFPFDAPWR